MNASFSFFLVLLFIARMPTRVYHSVNLRSYAVLYHPTISVGRQKKLVFNDKQYTVIPQKLDNISGPERSIKIRVDLGKGLLSIKRNFYLIEAFFRSQKDIRQLRTHRIETDEPKADPVEDEGDIWQTVVDNQGQPTSLKQSTSSSRRNSMR